MPTHILQRAKFGWVSAALAALFTPVTALAQGAGTFASGAQEIVGTVTVYIVAGLNMLAWVAFVYLTQLLDTDFIFNSEGGNQTFTNVLNNIWMLSRDLMNVGFAVILIGVAVYTVVFANMDFAKQHISKLALCIIAINFSWFVPRLIIDISNVATSTIYGIPSLLTSQGVIPACSYTVHSKVPPEGSTCSNMGADTFRCQCEVVVDAQFFVDKNRLNDLKTAGYVCPLGKALCIKKAAFDPNTTAGSLTVLNGLVVNFARLQSLATVPTVNVDDGEVSALITFILREILVLAIHIALFFPLAAMAIAFAVRIPFLWITIAFMPFTFLQFVLPEQYITEYPKKIWDYFLKAAFLPAIVAIPLTIGFILVNAAMQLTMAAPLKGVNLKLTDGVNDFWELLWLGMTLAVLWVGVFTALGKVEGIAIGSQTLHDMGLGLGKMVAKAPFSAKIIPTPSGESTSILSKLKSYDPREIYRKMSNGGAAAGGGGGKADIPPPISLPGDLTKAFNTLKNDPDKQQKLIDGIDKLSNQFKAKGSVTAAEVRDALKTTVGREVHIENLSHDNVEKKLTDLQYALKNTAKVDTTKLEGSINTFKDVLKQTLKP